MHKSSKSKSRSRRWGEYSEWVWEAERQFWYRVRQDADGELDYETAGNDSHTATRSDDEPRYPESGVDDITQGMADLTAQPDSYEAQYQASGSRASASGRSRSGKSSSKGKGKAQDSPHDQYGQPIEEEGGYTYSSSANVPIDPYIPETTYPQTSYPQGLGSSSRAGTYGQREPAYTSLEPTYDPKYSTTNDPYSYEDPYSVSGSAYGSYSAYEPEDADGRSEGRLTPKAASSSRTAQTTQVDPEALDPRYRLERSDRFQPGEIFKAGWAEPKGGAANEALTGLSGKQEIQDIRGVTFITGFRRFIVIANDQGHSTCVPILSYGGKACTKRGVKPEKHGIIYQRGQRAKPLEHEPKLGFQPVKVDITMEGEKLSRESRVNYSKLVTVEHNVKVMFIGQIVAADWPIVTDAINRCWDMKDHHKRSRRHK